MTMTMMADDGGIRCGGGGSAPPPPLYDENKNGNENEHLPLGPVSDRYITPNPQKQTPPAHTTP